MSSRSTILLADFCVYNIKKYINSLYNIKVLKKPKYNNIRQKIDEFKNILENDQIDKENCEIKLFQIIFDCLNTEFLDIHILTLDCLQKLFINNYFIHIMSQNKNYFDELFKLIAQVYKRNMFNNDVELNVIRVFIAITNVNKPYIHIYDIAIIINFFIKIISWSKSPDNKSAIKAALDTIVINIFMRFENNSDKDFHSPVSNITLSGDIIGEKLNSTECYEENINNEETINDTILDEKDKVDDKNSIHNDEKISINTSERTSISNTPTINNSDDMTIKFGYRYDLKKIYEEYNLDWNDNKLVDAFVIYDILCKASILDNKESNLSMDIKCVRCALELIYLILTYADNNFRNNECFTDLTRKYLFNTITQSSITKNEALFKVALNIFVLLLEKFRSTLKVQIQMFFEEVIFKILESDGKSTVEQIMIVLKELKNICSSVKFMSVLFVNYDCDIESHNVFERLINNLCSIAKNPSKIILITPHNNNQQFISNSETSIKNACLNCIINILCLLKDRAEELNIYNETHQDELSENDENIKCDKQLSSSSVNYIGFVKERKDSYEEGIKIFNIKPFEGIKYLIDNEFIPDTAKDIAEFLHNENRLDLAKIGTILGDGNEKWINVMQKYVEYINVSNMSFLPSLRLFLSNFRLPGEAQKIDRIVEKFASHYYQQNQDNENLKNADVTYLLAYSIIMLTTDLHNPYVKNKITPAQYIEMNKNSDGTTNFTEEYLLNIYDDISRQEITLRSSSTTSSSILGCYNSKISNYVSKITEMTKSLLLISTSFSQTEFIEEVESDDTTKSMFSTIWKHLLVCFGWVFKESDKFHIIQDCLNGIRYCVRISCLYKLDFIRDTFINCLLPFTSLIKNNIIIDEIMSKNVAAIQIILHIAREDGNYLSHCWGDILKAISNLDVLQNINKHETTSNSPTTSSSKRLVLNDNLSLPIIQQPYTSRINYYKNTSSSLKILDEISSQQLIVLSDHIFTNSVHFDAGSIIYFVSCLCDTSKTELLNCKIPRYFALQKIIEVAYYNMNRERIIWHNIWSILSPYLMWVSSLENETISIFCIDSIRQLSCKFLERKEFNNFHYQSDFFQPFQYILLHNKFISVKELGMRCVLQIIQNYGSNIISGWKVVFIILEQACNDYESFKTLEPFVFDSLTSIIDKYFYSIIEYIDILLKCLQVFSFKDQNTDINICSLRLYGICFEKFCKFKPSDNFIMQINHNSLVQIRWEYGWRKILISLIYIIQYSSTSIRSETILMLFNILQNYSTLINDINIYDILITDLFTVFNPIFSTTNISSTTDFTRKKNQLWLSETCSSYLMGITELFCANYHNHTLACFIKNLQDCVQSQYDVLTSCSIYSFRRLVTILHHKFDDTAWDSITCFIENICQFTFDSLFYKFQYENNNLEIFSSDNNSHRADHLSDYSSYNLDFIRKVCPLVLIERENTTNPNVIQIHQAIMRARLDLEFGECIAFIFGFTDNSISSSPSTNTNTIMQSSNIKFPIIPDEYLKKMLSIFIKHQNEISSKNSDEKYIYRLANHVEHYSPAMKQLWRGKISPNMCVQECIWNICILKLVEIFCSQNKFQQCSYDIFEKNISIILKRYNSLYQDCTDKFKCHYIVYTILKILDLAPTQFYNHVIISIYPLLCPLIKIHLSDHSLDLLLRVFQKLHPLLTALHINVVD